MSAPNAPADADRTRPRRASRANGTPGLPSWLVPTSVAETLALAGVTAYGATYLACVLFYGPLGIEPADVGLGYVEVLAQAAVYLALLLGINASVIVPLLYFRSRMGPAPPGSPGLGPARLVRSNWLLGSIAVAVTLYLLVVSAIAGSEAVQHGSPPYDSLSFGLSVQPWSDAQVASVRWTGPGTAPPIPGCLIRLGEAAGTEVFYSPVGNTTLMLPQSSISVVIRPELDSCI
jgi:hypothetical protein